MRKFFLIGLKDLKLIVRDKTALTFMLLAPFLLTLGMGVVTGQFSGGGGIENIPVVIVNQDNGELGQTLIALFQSEGLADLVSVTLLDDPAAARQQVDDDQAAMAVIVPAGFTVSIIPQAGQSEALTAVQIILYSNPTRPTSARVIKSIVEEFIARVEIGRVSGIVTITQLIGSGLVAPQEAHALALTWGREQAEALAESETITLSSNITSQTAVNFNPLAYFAPGLALMFLMFTVSNGGRSLLAERDQGTLSRLQVAPTNAAQVLGGKILGVYLTGVAQMLILVGGCALLFHLEWGSPLAVLALILAAVFGACGWGILITALAKSPNQVTSIGSAIMLTFGMLGGTFVDLSTFPNWVQWFSKITPNAWGLSGFSTLALGGGLRQVANPIFGLLAMGAILFVISLLIFNRRGTRFNPGGAQ